MTVQWTRAWALLRGALESFASLRRAPGTAQQARGGLADAGA